MSSTTFLGKANFFQTWTATFQARNDNIGTGDFSSACCTLWTTPWNFVAGAKSPFLLDPTLPGFLCQRLGCFLRLSLSKGSHQVNGLLHLHEKFPDLSRKPVSYMDQMDDHPFLIWSHGWDHHVNQKTCNVGSTIVKATPPIFFFLRGGSLRNCKFM